MIMEKNLLAQARKYEKTYGEQISPEERPVYHVSPTVGWLNDPNGFSFYNGKYHLFYQYNPYSTRWSSLHWGHLVSEDLIHWDRLPVVMAPDEEYDNAGVWSGSAVALPDGRHLLMYTGMHVSQLEDGSVDIQQTQCLAYGDGVDYEKFEGNPVIRPEALPEGSSKEDFRDPKLWWDEEEQCFYAVACSRTAHDGGAAVLFRSADAVQWEYVSTLDKSDNKHGTMWECPDFFSLDGTDVLIVSPMEMLAEGLEFHNGQNVAFLLGSYDKKQHTFHRKEIHALDHGLDFYAPQSLLAPDGRRILIAWMQSPENQHSQPHGIKWFGQMTVPRELSIKKGKLIQTPVRELKQFRKNLVAYRNIYIRERLRLPGVSGRSVDMTVAVRPAGGALYQKFTIKVAKDADCYTAVTYDPNNSVLRFDRSHSGFRYDIVATRKAHIRYQKGKIKLRLLIDRFSVEVFVNDGEQVLTATLYTPQSADGISFEATGSAIVDVKKYDLVV